MQVVRGKRLTLMSAEELAPLRAAADRVVVDVGAGDARASYRLAAAEPGTLVVGLDPAWTRLVPTGLRAARKPARGGLRNLTLVAGTAEDPPAELHGLADEVLVVMPWGSLLRGVVAGAPDVCRGLRRLAAPGAVLEVAVGTSIWRDPVPRPVRDLPELTPPYVERVLADRLLAHGWQLTGSGWLTSTELVALSSSWARRLGGSRPEPTARLTAQAVATEGADPGAEPQARTTAGPQTGPDSEPQAQPTAAPRVDADAAAGRDERPWPGAAGQHDDEAVH